MENIRKQLKFLNEFIAKELRFTISNYCTLEKTMVLWEKNGPMKKIHDTIPKTMELLFTMEKLWYYGSNYGTMEKSMVL